MHEELKDSKEFHNYGDKIIQQLSIDCVVFGFHENQLKVLLLKTKYLDLWMLPGGFVLQEEDTDAAAQRILAIRTGIQNIYLELFSVFGNVNRQFSEIHQAAMVEWGYKPDPNHWLCKRFVSIGYYALVDFSKVIPTADELSVLCGWFDIAEIPNLAFDHMQIFQKALEQLRQNLDTKLVGFNLLPPTFTMGELQSLYETFLGKKLSRTNFQRKMLSIEVLERVEKKFSGGAHKAPYLYRFDEKKGQAFLEKKHF
jgi:8-oxo-dGTP diphosphatase